MAEKSKTEWDIKILKSELSACQSTYNFILSRIESLEKKLKSIQEETEMIPILIKESTRKLSLREQDAFRYYNNASAKGQRLILSEIEEYQNLAIQHKLKIEDIESKLKI